MNGLPDWAVFVLIGIVLLLAGGSGAWLCGSYIVGEISKFISKYSKSK